MSSHVICLGRLSDPQTATCRFSRNCYSWSRDRTRLSDYLQAHRGPGADRSRIHVRRPGILDPQRDIAEAMEAKYARRPNCVIVLADFLLLVGQAFINLAAAGGAIAGPLIMGALQRGNPQGGWRTFYVGVCGFCHIEQSLTFVLVD